MKRILLTLTVSLTLILSGCGVPGKDDTKDKNKQVNVKGTKPTIRFLGQASYQNDMNIVKQQLERAGFNVKMNVQPDYGSYRTQRQAGNYDIQIDDWTTVFGDPNYAMNAIFSSTGSNSLIKDPKIDALINKASKENTSEAKNTYKKLEDKVIFNEGFMAPLYGSKKNLVYDNKILNKNSVGLPNSRALIWQQFDYNDKKLRNTRPLVMTQPDGEFQSLDPIRSIAPNVYNINMNMYTRLLTLNDNDKITTDGSLSRSYTSNKDNNAFYFLLRDDNYFVKVKNGKAENTHEKVLADDVLFSLNRARDKNAVPNHVTYNMHKHIKDITELTNDDKKELKKTKTASGKSVWDTLTKGYKVKDITNQDSEVNNAEGKYQIIKITTDQPMPKEVNYLTHSSAGILSKHYVEKLKEEGKDFGAPNTVPKSDDGQNELVTSGAYIMTKKRQLSSYFPT